MILKKNIWILFLGLSSLVQAQLFGTKEPDTRSVVVVSNDSSVYTNILVEEHHADLDPRVNYYWYMSNNIRSNQGDYSGSLLHGSYEVFTPDKKMLVKGNFAYGLKDGIWKEWYHNGNTKSVTGWQDGLLEGKAEHYLEDGSKKLSCEYNNGLRHGACKTYRNDTVYSIKKYKKGVLVSGPDEPDESGKRNGFFQWLTKPFSSAARNDTIQDDEKPEENND